MTTGGDGSPLQNNDNAPSRLKKDGSSFSAGINELTDIGLIHRGSREAIVGRMRDMCRVRQEQKKFADSLEEEIMQLEQGGGCGGGGGWTCAPHTREKTTHTFPTHPTFFLVFL